MRFFVSLFVFFTIVFTLDSRKADSRKSRKSQRIKSKTSENVMDIEPPVKRKKNIRGAIVPVKKKSSVTKIAWKRLEYLSESIKSTAQMALESSAKLKRSVKSYFSSDFEVLLLRMTSPVDERPTESDIDRFTSTIDSFVRNMDVTSSSNPYRVTLRKLWNKMAESDARTTLKALLLLHILLKSTDPDDSMIFKALMNKMGREHCKKSNSKYFDPEIVNTVSDKEQRVAEFIDTYSTYVFKRARAFTSSFEEMKLIAETMSKEDICAQLLKACKLIKVALACHPAANEDCEVIMGCLQQVTNDLRELFSLYHVKLKMIIKEDKAKDLFHGWDDGEITAILNHFKAFYNERYDSVSSFLQGTSALLQAYGIKVSAKLDPPLIFVDQSVSTEHVIEDAKGMPLRVEFIPSLAPQYSDFGTDFGPSSFDSTVEQLDAIFRTTHSAKITSNNVSSKSSNYHNYKNRNMATTTIQKSHPKKTMKITSDTGGNRHKRRKGKNSIPIDNARGKPRLQSSFHSPSYLQVVSTCIKYDDSMFGELDDDRSADGYRGTDFGESWERPAKK